jgi:hypothetical protein
MRAVLSTLLAAGSTILLAAFAFAPEAGAHHSTAYFLRDKSHHLTIQGKVNRFEWRSPHSYIVLDTKEGEWRIETNYTSMLASEGWTKETLKPGDQLTAEVYSVSDFNARYGWLRIATKADGTVLRTSETSLRRQAGNIPAP